MSLFIDIFSHALLTKLYIKISWHNLRHFLIQELAGIRPEKFLEQLIPASEPAGMYVRIICHLACMSLNTCRKSCSPLKGIDISHNMHYDLIFF